jgi:hypothetical protein
MEEIKYKNGNADIIIKSDGTREIEYEDELNLEFPLNIDIRTNSKCSFGLNPKTGKAFCSFCHESASTNGSECDYDELKNKLIGLPKGIELAVGGNSITPNLMEFCKWATNQGYIVNLTVNQGHIATYQNKLDELIENRFIKGLGISYRRSLEKDNVPERFKKYEHTVLHVIAGIDDINDILNNTSYRKVLVLGEKNFGLNFGKVDLNTRSHKEWLWWIHKMFGVFNVVSFDNLALQQLNIKRFFTDDNWEVFNQSEHSFYIDAVNKILAPSSRSSDKTKWDGITLKEYFKKLQN